MDKTLYVAPDSLPVIISPTENSPVKFFNSKSFVTEFQDSTRAVALLADPVTTSLKVNEPDPSKYGSEILTVGASVYPAPVFDNLIAVIDPLVSIATAEAEVDAIPTKDTIGAESYPDPPSVTVITQLLHLRSLLMQQHQPLHHQKMQPLVQRCIHNQDL